MKSIFYDIDCLVSFLLIDRFDKVYMSNKVFEIYTNPSIASDIRDGIKDLVLEDFIKVEEISLNTSEFDIYYSLINDKKTDRYIGKGEASTIALAVKHHAIVLCNDCRNAGVYLKKYGFEYFRYIKKSLSEEDHKSG